MTVEQWEAFTERAAILEYDGRLDRRAATLRAFELSFPGDFRECMKTAAGQPDGKTALYEYIEGLIKTGPESAEKGHRLNAETEKVQSHGTAPDKPPQGQKKRTGYELMKEQINQRLRGIA
jgi:cell wall assembly regulator SMI1